MTLFHLFISYMHIFLISTYSILFSKYCESNSEDSGCIIFVNIYELLNPICIIFSFILSLWLELAEAHFAYLLSPEMFQIIVLFLSFICMFVLRDLLSWYPLKCLFFVLYYIDILQGFLFRIIVINIHIFVFRLLSNLFYIIFYYEHFM